MCVMHRMSLCPILHQNQSICNDFLHESHTLVSSTWVGESVSYATPLLPLPRPSTSQIIPPVSVCRVALGPGALV